jgi:hypothetical protein
MRRYYLFLAGVALLFSACIGDDIIDDRVPAEVRITDAVDTLALGTQHTFRATFLNELGLEESRPITWRSSEPAVIDITATGLATALAIGQSELSAEATLADNSVVRATRLVTVGESTVAGPNTRSGALRTTSSYLLEGDFVISIPAGNLLIELADNYRASTALPGLYLYLSNNPNSTNGALEIGAVEVFEGAHTYTVPNVGIDEYAYLLYYCKPFNVKVGDGEINQ